MGLFKFLVKPVCVLRDLVLALDDCDDFSPSLEPWPTAFALPFDLAGFFELGPICVRLRLLLRVAEVPILILLRVA
jgi:hypothetical protein